MPISDPRMMGLLAESAMSFDGFSFKKIGRAIGSAAKGVAKGVSSAVKPLDVTNRNALLGKFATTTVGKIALAPIVAPVAWTAKGATAALAATGAKPFKKLDQYVGKGYRSSVTTGLRKTAGVELATVAAVGATFATGGGAIAMTAAALPGAKLLATGQASKASVMSTIATGVTGITAGIGTKSVTGLVKGLTGGGSPSEAPPPIPSPEEAIAEAAVTDQPVSSVTPGAGRSAGSVVAPAALAAGGFLVAGPIGAIVGGVAGFFMGRSKPKPTGWFGEDWSPSILDPNMLPDTSVDIPYAPVYAPDSSLALAPGRTSGGPSMMTIGLVGLGAWLLLSKKSGGRRRSTRRRSRR
jgi:hypothetical protein